MNEQTIKAAESPREAVNTEQGLKLLREARDAARTVTDRLQESRKVAPETLKERFTR